MARGREMRVLVCGGRDFDDVGLMISALDRLHTEKSFTVVIHGNARGADTMADAWARCRGVPREPYHRRHCLKVPVFVALGLARSMSALGH
jgi:hypothetical protein